MGACREGFDLTHKFGRYHWQKRSWRDKPWKLMFEDTFLQFVCKVIEHKPYNAGDPGQVELACNRCHKWLR